VEWYRKKRQPSICKTIILHYLLVGEVRYNLERSPKLSPGGLRQFTLSPVRDNDRTQELGLTLLGHVPMLALYVSTLAFYVLSVTMML